MTTKEFKPTRPSRDLAPLTLENAFHKLFNQDELRPQDYLLFLSQTVGFAMQSEVFAMHLDQPHRRQLFAMRFRYLCEFLEDMDDLGFPD